MLNKSNILLGISILSAFLCSYNSFIGFRAIIVVCMLLLVFEQKYYLMYPIVLFFYTQYGLFLGLSVLRLFSAFLILNFIVQYKTAKRLKVSLNDLLLFSVYFIYIILVLSTESLSLGVSTLLNTLTMGILAFFYLTDEAKLGSFFRVYNIVALLSILAGMKQSNNMINHQIIGGEEIEISRFMGTFDDPNYLTFFCYIAIISLLTLKLFDKRVRIALIIIFQVCIFSTLSITGIVCGAIIWFTYIMMTKKKINIRTLVIMLCVALGLYMGYNYGIQHPETPVLGDLAVRVYEKLSFLDTGDITGVTTGRSSFSQMHFEYFMNQSFWKILFGGNLANTKIMQVGNMRFAAHNEYVDLLLNIGVVGATIFFSCIFGKSAKLYRLKRYNETKANYCNCVILVKIVWFLYAATLTMFLEERFMLFIFL